MVRSLDHVAETIVLGLALYLRVDCRVAAEPVGEVPALAWEQLHQLGGLTEPVAVINRRLAPGVDGLDEESYRSKKSCWLDAIIQNLDRRLPGGGFSGARQSGNLAYHAACGAFGG